MTISKSKGPCLLDTNVLVYATDTSSPFHSASKTLRDKGMKGDVSICITPQILLEFFAVITSPKRVNSPRESGEAIKEIQKYLLAEKIIKIYPKEDSFDRTLEILQKHKIKGQEIFDAQLVATMLSNNVATIYTYDIEHFSIFDVIEVLTP